ncbi:hypothetical protein OH77DRAFT_1421887, partial [Trametes cingulata]
LCHPLCSGTQNGQHRNSTTRMWATSCPACPVALPLPFSTRCIHSRRLPTWTLGHSQTAERLSQPAATSPSASTTDRDAHMHALDGPERTDSEHPCEPGLVPPPDADPR